ncbi:MAG TPA: pilus assembly protein TadG-related protein [Pirellulales bacterium]|jgi:Flp pilus assembly protein TadG|nr:pilus assembly protein TadG-related protein [Pirellulales bacterium]
MKKAAKVRQRRRGSILPLFAVAMIPFLGFLALSIDLGLLAIARTQCQNAADNAAIAAVRTLNGSTSGNTTAATTNAQKAGTLSPVLGQSLATSDMTITHGSYHYNTTTQSFSPQFPPVSPDNYNLTQVVVTPARSGFFSRVFGLTSFNISATAQAVYRPRDVAIVLDFSGSMNNETDLWNCESYLGTMLNTPNNTDSSFPQWGIYAPSYSANANLQCTSSDTRVGNCNITTTIGGIPPLVNDFYSNNRGSSAASAFTAAPGSVTSTTQPGDAYLTTSTNKSGNPPGRTVAEVSGSTSLTNTTNKNFASQGYKYFTSKTFSGYQEGPGYWGKTFFIWPPDQLNDWRQNYFIDAATLTGVQDNTALWDSGGNWLDPPGNYEINYKAILAWIKTAPAPFPAQLRAGNILYYSTIPTDVPATAYDHTQPNSNITNQDQRFWKEYIDFVVGVWRDPTGTIQHPGSSTCSYGPDFAAGDGTGVSITGPDSATKYNGVAYVAPTDNPLRPRHRLWFGAATMIQYILDTGLTPGTTHDISMVPAKLGIAGAITDIQNNHPNDMISMIYYSRPTYTGETGQGQFDAPIYSLGRSYSTITTSLWYPPNSSTADVRPWDANGNLAPGAHGDYDSNTATSYGLRLAYNQLSSAATLRSSSMGGYGRVGAQRLVILETDGMANVATSCTGSTGAAYNSYFNIGTGNSYSAGSNDPANESVTIARQICAQYNDSSYGLPGFATTSRPVTIQCIAFGAVFEPSTPAADNTAGIAMLQSISTIGGSTFPSSSGDPTNGYKWCIGTLSQRQTKLQQAFTTIMDSTVPIVLIK